MGIDAGAGGRRLPAARSLRARRLSFSGSPPESETCRVAVERVLSIHIKDVGTCTLMCTPAEARALAAGFLFTEGLVAALDEVKLLSECGDEPGVVRVELTDPARARERARTLAVTGSCATCGGGRSAQELLAGLPPVGDSLRVPGSLLRSVAEELCARQEVFRETGGTHAAGIFRPDGGMLAFAEDIGRHNALDKAVGKCLLEKRRTAGAGVFLSGRASFELVAKSARAGLELVAAVSAPTSLAVEAAERCGLTLCSFVREGRATVFTHPRRITDLEDPGGRPGEA